jgi:hypothetical protein
VLVLSEVTSIDQIHARGKAVDMELEVCLFESGMVEVLDGEEIKISEMLIIFSKNF